jgi:hypothetical protein
MSTREIGDVLGVSRQTVIRDEAGPDGPPDAKAKADVKAEAAAESAARREASREDRKPVGDPTPDDEGGPGRGKRPSESEGLR